MVYAEKAYGLAPPNLWFSYVKPLIGKFRLNAENREVKHNGFVIRRLTKTEFAILLMLYSKRNEEVTHKELESIWNGSVMNYHSLYNYISKLRELLVNDQTLSIETTEHGYKLSF